MNPCFGFAIPGTAISLQRILALLAKEHNPCALPLGLFGGTTKVEIT
jgi:hypothetical protein